MCEKRYWKCFVVNLTQNNIFQLGIPHVPERENPVAVFFCDASALDHFTQRTSKEFSGAESPSFRYLICRNPPMPLRVACHRVVGLVASGLFRNPFEVRCVDWRVLQDLDFDA